MKYFYPFFSMAVLALATVIFSSCKDDEDPKSTIGFGTETVEINESAGTIDIDIEFDRPLSDNVTIKFTTSGTSDLFNAGTEQGDFKLPDGKTFTVNKGQSGATISIELLEDFDVEIEDEDNLYETLILTLTEVQGNALLGTSKVITVKILEDDMIMVLDWDRTADEDIDMDLLVWYYDTEESAFAFLGGSYEPGNALEIINVPAGFINGTYGFGYPYYSGTDDDLDFAVDFINLGGKLNGADEDLRFLGHYTLANINEWAQASQTLVTHQVTKTGVNYNEFTEIETPESGSRMPGSLRGQDILKASKAKSKISLKARRAITKILERKK